MAAIDGKYCFRNPSPGVGKQESDNVGNVFSFTDT